jgi:hypothetical protein
MTPAVTNGSPGSTFHGRPPRSAAGVTKARFGDFAYFELDEPGAG